MTPLNKFLFDTSFDPAPEVEGPAEPPAPTFSEEELAAARAEGFAAGQEAGRAEMRASIERDAAAALAAIGRELSAMNGRFAEIREHAIDGGIAVVSAALRKIVPELARRHGMAEIEQVVRDNLQSLYDEPRVVIRAHDSVIAVLQERMDGIAASCGFGGKIILFGDPQFGETDCRVEWADGGAERNLGELWRRIDAAIERVTDGRAVPDPAILGT